MRDADRRLVELAAQQHQVFSRAQAREHGLTSSAISRRVARGSLVACGVTGLRYAGTALAYRGRLTVGLLDLGSDALVSGRAAANLLGLDGFAEGPLEFLVPRSQRDRRAEGVVRSSPTILPLDRAVVDGIPCTSATRTVVELLAGASIEEAGNALASATRKRLTAPAVVERRLAELGRQGRAGVAVFQQLLRDGVVESWLERRFLATIREAGLPVPVVQERHRLEGFGVVRVDFAYPTDPIVVEVGGSIGYLSRAERQRQERRRTALQLVGKTVYFFTTDDVRRHPEFVIATLDAALGSRVAG